MLALGSVPRTLPIPGLAEHGLGFKNLADAIHLRNHVLRELEAADAALDASRAERHLRRWKEEQYTGTGFPTDFMIRYHLCRLDFPLLALGRLRERIAR